MKGSVQSEQVIKKCDLLSLFNLRAMFTLHCFLSSAVRFFAQMLMDFQQHLQIDGGVIFQGISSVLPRQKCLLLRPFPNLSKSKQGPLCFALWARVQNPCLALLFPFIFKNNIRVGFNFLAPSTAQLLHATIYLFFHQFIYLFTSHLISAPLSPPSSSYTAPHLSLLVLDADCLLGGCQLQRRA